MRTSNLEKVRKAVTSQASSAPDLQQRTGLSYNTVRRALSQLGAVEIPGKYPAVYMIPGNADKQLDKKEGGNLEVIDRSGYLLIPDVDRPVTLDLWNSSIPSLSKNLLSFTIDEKTDIGALAKRLRTAASLFAHQALVLEQAAQHPDAYERLGGDSNTETPFG